MIDYTLPWGKVPIKKAQTVGRDKEKAEKFLLGHPFWRENTA
jgi:hypothetical protein